MHNVTIGGQPRTLGDFNAFKAVLAMEIVADAETAVRDLVHQAGDFRTEYAARHALEMSRVEARRQYRPEPLYVQHRRDDDVVEVLPLLRDQQPVLGPDPLGHLTDADWQASGNVLRIPEFPDETAVIAALVPKAFAASRAHVLRLLALTLTSNRDLEKWDSESGDVLGQLDGVGATLLHEASAAELLALVVAVVASVREQIAGPFVQAREAIRQLLPGSTTPQEEVQPMRPESTSSEPSSTSSPAATDGIPSPSSTAPAGV